MPKFKARLFRYIQTHPGQSSADLAKHFYTQLNSNPAVSIRSHIYQINEALMGTTVRIRGDQFVGYYIEEAAGTVKEWRPMTGRASAQVR